MAWWRTLRPVGALLGMLTALRLADRLGFGRAFAASLLPSCLAPLLLLAVIPLVISLSPALLTGLVVVELADRAGPTWTRPRCWPWPPPVSPTTSASPTWSASPSPSALPRASAPSSRSGV